MTDGENQTDTRTAIQLERLHGKMESNAILTEQRFNQLHEVVTETKVAVQNVHKEVNERIDRHEEQETPKLDTVRRLVWIAVGAITVLSGLFAFGMSAFKDVLFK